MSASRPRRARRGFALFLALLVLLVATISAIALLFNTQVESSLSSAQTKISRVFYAADSGIGWAGEELRTNAQFFAAFKAVNPSDPNTKYTAILPAPSGTANVSMSSNLPGQTTEDIVVTLEKPTMVGWVRHPGDQIAASGSAYGPPEIVETFYHLTSTASSTQISANKSITCDMGIYPSQLQIAR